MIDTSLSCHECSDRRIVVWVINSCSSPHAPPPPHDSCHPILALIASSNYRIACPVECQSTSVSGWVETHKLSMYTLNISLSFASFAFSASTSVTRTSRPLRPSRSCMISLMTRSFSKADSTVGSDIGPVGAAHGDCPSSKAKSAILLAAHRAPVPLFCPKPGRVECPQPLPWI